MPPKLSATPTARTSTPAAGAVVGAVLGHAGAEDDEEEVRQHQHAPGAEAVEELAALDLLHQHQVEAGDVGLVGQQVHHDGRALVDRGDEHVEHPVGDGVGQVLAHRLQGRPLVQGRGEPGVALEGRAQRQRPGAPQRHECLMQRHRRGQAGGQVAEGVGPGPGALAGPVLAHRRVVGAGQAGHADRGQQRHRHRPGHPRHHQEGQATAQDRHGPELGGVDIGPGLVEPLLGPGPAGRSGPGPQPRARWRLAQQVADGQVGEGGGGQGGGQPHLAVLLTAAPLIGPSAAGH